MCLRADIPFKKINKMKPLFQRYFSCELPSETQCRRIVKNMDTVAMKTSLEDLKFQKIFAIVDETRGVKYCTAILYYVLQDLINDLERDDCTMLEGYRKICELIKNSS